MVTAFAILSQNLTSATFHLDGAVQAKVLLPCNRDERMQALNTFHELKVTHAWKSVLEVVS